MSKKVSLSELMGKNASESGSSGSLSLDQLPDILGDAMPDLPKNTVGRYRLLRSLKARFGPNFRSLPGVGNLLKEFDSVVDTEIKVQKLKNIRLKDFKR